MDKEILSKLKGLVSNNRQWDHFSNYLDVLIAQQHKTLEQSEDMVFVHKAQGAIEALRKIRRLREDIAQADGS
jgi:predicted Rossmann-fold nucleotide-binding protein